MTASAPRELVEMVTALPGYTSAVGTRVLWAEVGRVHLVLDRRPDLLQFNGHFHGGVLAGLADHAAGGAVTTALPPGRIGVTVDLDIHFLTPADGDAVVAKAEALPGGKTICVAKVDLFTLRDGEERACALAIVTLRAVDLPTPPVAAAPG